jgi:transcriptional regulator with XRE-family HTH domain
MAFSDRLAGLRKQRGLTQQALADRAGVHVVQVRRYEGGGAEPSLEIVRKLAVALAASADELLFEKDERSPDEDLKLQFEAISRFDLEERKVAKALLESLILRHEAKRWSSSA